MKKTINNTLIMRSKKLKKIYKIIKNQNKIITKNKKSKKSIKIKKLIINNKFICKNYQKTNICVLIFKM